MTFKEQLEITLRDQELRGAKAAALCGMSNQQFNRYVLGHTIPSFDKGCQMLESLSWRVIAVPEVNFSVDWSNL